MKRRQEAGSKRGTDGKPTGSDPKGSTTGGKRPFPAKPNTTRPVPPRSVPGQPPTQRIRPGTRAVNRESKNMARPMPQPPARRPLARSAAVALNEEQKAEADRLEREFERLEKQAQLSTIYDDIGKFDSKLVEYPLAVDGLRARGYVHSGQLEDQIEALDDKWDEVRPRLEVALQQQVRRLDGQLKMAQLKMNQMNNLMGMKAAETAVSTLSTQVPTAESTINGLYQGLENELDSIGYRLSNLSTMLDLYEGSPEIRLYEAEGPLMAVEAEWEQNGDEGPDGYLFLTDQRLIFEQREEVVTKRRFGIFKAESEKIQKVLIEVQAHEIEQVSHKEEGGFLGMGKADILELVFAATAPVTRARFHLKGQDSSDWAVMIKQVQTGEIDRDRAEDYLDDVETAKTVMASFPTQCPACFAAVAPPPRGATSVTCEFCSTVILPQMAA